MKTPYMKREFLPVGHGAFYHECFVPDSGGEPINIVYDCGSLASLRNVLQPHIEKAFPPGSRIQAIFLSHLHKDHYSGLATLLRRYNVDKVVFPLIDEGNKVLMGYWMQMQDLPDETDGFAYSFLMNPEKAIRDLDIPGHIPELIAVPISRVSSMDGSARPVMELYANEIQLVELNGGQAFTDGPFADWRFISYNIEQPEVINKLKERLAAKGICPPTNNSLQNAWVNVHNQKKIRSVFSDVLHNEFNANSMLLFSGVHDHDHLIQTRKENGAIQLLPSKMKKPGCLYTGDYMALPSEYSATLKTAYNTYWDDIGCVQIPHHGSDKNFSSDLLDLDAYFVLSAKDGDAKHPGSYVRTQLSGKNWQCVTEKEESALKLMVVPPSVFLWTQFLMKG